MRLGLFKRLGRLFSSSAGPEAGGRHRRNTGTAPPGERPASRPFAGQPAEAAQTARPERPDWPAGPVQSPPWAPARAPAPPRTASPALPPMPRNYTPNPHGNSAGGNRASGYGSGGAGRARIREAPGEAPRDAPVGTAPVEMAVRPAAGELTHGESRQAWYQVVGSSPPSARALARPGQAGAAATAPVAAPARAAAQAANRVGQAQLPFTTSHPSGYRPRPDGRRHCGPLESILWRQWDSAIGDPPPETVAAIDRLAEFPRQLQEKLAAGLDGIYVGAGGVPDLDHMAALHGVALPSGKATWDACAGAYGDRKIVVGTRPSPTPDVMCHEVGHALDDLDSPPGKWQSDSAEFRGIYDQCQSSIASDFHRQRGGLGRKEFFADSFAAIASSQRPALVDMLGGNTRIALRVMLYFNRRYGI